ncbi:MAG: GNAT family N-acetyltransferase [Gammaproteobacteria bacterium]|nr:GNAT family N-acetyltransferase [Gammaproteobacteria bacterium]
MQVRRFKAGEEDVLRRICWDTTLKINIHEYGAELVQKWVARLKDKSRWEKRIYRKNPFVAEQNETVIGFAELTKTGKIRAFYSHYDWQGKGVGKALYEAIETEASRLEMDSIQVESSSSASSFFTRKGFYVVREKLNLTDGIPSKSLLMQKRLVN